MQLNKTQRIIAVVFGLIAVYGCIGLVSPRPLEGVAVLAGAVILGTVLILVTARRQP